MGGDELLLLADRSKEAERVRTEADQPDDRERREARKRARREHRAGTKALPRKHEERQREARGELHADACRERERARADASAKWRRGCDRSAARAVRPRCRARTGARLCGQRERGRDREHHERVVVRAAHAQLEQHGVQPDERRRPARRMPERARGARDERDRAEARERGDDLQRPQSPGEPEWSRRVAREREQGAIRRVLEGPADEHERGVVRRVGGDARVRVEAVQRAHAREPQVAERVLREQRRPEHERDVRGEDREREQRHRERACADEHEQVARAHDERERLEGARAEARFEAAQWSREPRRPAADARGDVLRGFARRSRGEQERAHEDRERAERRKRGAGRLHAPPAGAAQRPEAEAPARRRHRVGAGVSRARGDAHLEHFYGIAQNIPVGRPLSCVGCCASYGPEGFARGAQCRHAGAPVWRRAAFICDFATANNPCAGPPVLPTTVCAAS